MQKQESFDCRAPEPPPPEVITEHGVRFRVAPGSKHKTGFFLDQRDNRQLLASFCKGKRVLDLCCNTGGFAVYAKALGEAEEVVGVDLDEQALALAKQNANLNQARVRFVQADLFPWLRDIIADGQRFDVVVLDPAKQTRDREEVDFALKRYLDMNRLALQAVAPGGIFLTCSCTGLVSEDDFLETLRRAAWQAGRSVQVLRVAGAGADHPFLLHVPEGRYLKAVFCRRGVSDPRLRQSTSHPAALRSSSSFVSLLYIVLRLIPSSAAAAGLLPPCLSSTRRMCSISISCSVRGRGTRARSRRLAAGRPPC